jgi:hypothetical protein
VETTVARDAATAKSTMCIGGMAVACRALYALPAMQMSRMRPWPKRSRRHCGALGNPRRQWLGMALGFRLAAADLRTDRNLCGRCRPGHV